VKLSPDEATGGLIEPPVTGEIVRLLFALVDELKAYFDGVAEEFGLSPTQALALRDLDRPLPMGRLAQSLRCEPGNVTAVVDRLEARGLAERRSAPSDRRVRRIALTRRGRRLRESMGARLVAGVPGVATLSPADQRLLHELLARVLEGCAAASSAHRGTTPDGAAA
jgi:DNA-binding MarR family transcriptional regulator